MPVAPGILLGACVERTTELTLNCLQNTPLTTEDVELERCLFFLFLPAVFLCGRMANSSAGLAVSEPLLSSLALCSLQGKPHLSRATGSH